MTHHQVGSSEKRIFMHKNVIIFLLLNTFFMPCILKGSMKRDHSLSAYSKRRNVNNSPEPAAGEKTKKRDAKKVRFVVQKHAASHLHFDFRIEIDGVLVSWAVPKGPSLNPRHKRLAVRTDDHPLSYAKFEGVISEGNYGAGTVMVWDIGHATPIKHEKGRTPSLKTQLKNGHIKIFLSGKLLHGGYSLIRMKNDEWLLIKMNDTYADTKKNLTKNSSRSALSNRTMAEIKKQAQQ